MSYTNATTRITDGPELFQFLRHQVGNSKTLRLAVAFWGIGAAEKLGIEATHDVRVVCNLRLGGTNPREIRKLMHVAHVRHSDRLHSKVYLFDQGGAVGSSNVSANGLSYQEAESSGWHETNVTFGTGQLYGEASQAFDDVWEGANEITPGDLERAEVAWSARRFRLPFETRASTLLQAAMMDPEAFSDRRIFVWYSPYHFSEPADVMVKNKQDETKLGDNLSAFEVFPGHLDAVPKSADIICFSQGPRGGLANGQVWNLPLELEVAVVSDKVESDDAANHLVFCTRVPGIGRFDKFPGTDWKPVINSIAEHEGSGTFVELGEAIRRMNASKVT